MSSLFKLFGKSKSSKKSKDKKQSAKEEELQLPPELAAEVCSGKSKFTISHSGRYKAKRRERLTLNDQFYDGKESSAPTPQKAQRPDARLKENDMNRDANRASAGSWVRPAVNGSAKGTAL